MSESIKGGDYNSIGLEITTVNMGAGIENLIVIGGGDGLHRAGDDFYVKKTAVGSYLEDLHNQSTCFQLFTSEFTANSPDNLQKLGVSSKDIHTYPSIENILSVLVYSYTILSAAYEFSKKDDVTLLVFLPGFAGYLHLIPFLTISDDVVLYYGADPYRTIWTQRTATVPIRLISYPILDLIAVYNADLILYRDVGIKKRYNWLKQSKAFHRSKPLIDINEGDIYEREDTCKNEPIEILYVGTLSKRKGVSHLLDSIQQLRSAGLEIELTIVGNGDRFENLKEKSERIGIEDIVHFEGHISDKSELIKVYRSSDIFVLPALGEGFPRVLTEAMTQSLPIITTNVGEIGTRLSQDEVKIVEPGNPREIKEGIEELIQDQDLRKSQIKNGKDWVKDFVDETPYEQHSRLINTLITG